MSEVADRILAEGALNIFENYCCDCSHCNNWQCNKMKSHKASSYPCTVARLAYGIFACTEFERGDK